MNFDWLAWSSSDRRRAALPAFALLLGLLFLSAEWGSGIDRSLRSARDEIRTRDASGQIAIIEIDARSLAALDQWPWPRRHHGALIDRLSAAGASLLAFDVNFGVRSNEADDAALAEALARAGGLVALPTFQQNADADSSDVIETLPYELFRDHAFLAGVNVVADPDGLVRRLQMGTMTADTPRPSMASLLAEGEGDIDQMLEIDFAIDPATIPRFSFIDILEGRFDPADIAGKRLIVGGTAADMEDRYAVPRHGVLPGVVVQALGAETILAGGTPSTGNGLWPLLLAFALAVAASWPGRAWRAVIAIAGGVALLLLFPLATEQWLATTFPIVPALVTLLVTAACALLLEISDRHHRRSLVDEATGLPNLPALYHALGGDDERMVVVARIDRFEALAAGLGPTGAAALVQRLAERLATECGRTVYRPDEHSLAWEQPVDCPERLDSMLGRVAALMRTPIECGRLVDVTLGLGVAAPLMPEGVRHAFKQQVANAALAAERALRDRRLFLHFADTNDEETGWHLSLLSELGTAMAAGEVWNAYQPKLDLRTGRICGVETLVRWTHRERGPVGPDRFIPVVEANGRAADLTAHVFLEALADAARWQALGHDLTVAVNVSATLLEDQDFIAWLGDTLRESPVPAAKIIVEVTESAAVGNVEQAAAALEGWRALGVGVSIDDYGTGQSSLGYLQRLPAGELKIDKSFIDDIVNDARNAIMVRSTVALAHQLGMKVVAEGVEDAATLAMLGELDCDVAQGWLIGKPMPSADLEAMLARPQALAA